MINDGTKLYDHQHDGSSQIQGSCIRDFRNKPLPIQLKIEYINQALSVRHRIGDMLFVLISFYFKDLYQQWNLT
jgi:mannose-binding lectin 1